MAALAAVVLISMTPAVPAAASAGTRLRVLSLNIFYGGDDLDLATGRFCTVPDGCPATLRQVERVIRQSGADIVGVQEPERNTERIAADLGWYGSNHAHVLSRFPIIDPPGADGRYVYVEVRPGRVVAIANTHLPSDPYGPYLVRDGGSLDDVLALEREVRLPVAEKLAALLPPLAAGGVPVLLTGDFNSPSHLDWTPAVATVRPEVHYPVRWPAAAALARAGLTDTYREVHPDPVAEPGFTWTPGGPESVPDEVHDRIDWVLRAGPASTVDSRVVGEADVRPYPSDHRGVVTTLDVRPATTPVLVAPASRRVTAGATVAVRFHGPGERVTLRDPHGRIVAEQPTGGRLDGTVQLHAPATAGRYAVTLEPGTTTAPVWVYPPGEPSRVTVDRRGYRAGEPIGISWSNAPGMNLDWVSVFPAGATDNTGYLNYDYTGATIEGSLSLDSTGLEPGRYVVRLLPDDGYRDVAESAAFTVR